MRKFLLILLVLLIGCGDDPSYPGAPRPTFGLAEGKIILTWDSVDDAESYEIYRAEEEGGDGVRIWSGEETRFEDTDVVENETYYYTVKSMGADGNVNYWIPAYEKTYVPPPPGIHITISDMRSGNVIADASVDIEGEGISDTLITDSSGICSRELELDGTYTLSISRIGYMRKTYQVDTSHEDKFELFLKPIPKVMATITDNARPFETPMYVVFSTDGNRAYVSNRYGDNVSVIDVTSDRVWKQIDVGKEPLGLAINPKEPLLYVVNHQDGTVSVINTDDNEVVGTPVEVGRLPTHAVVSGDGTNLYVVNSGDNTVSYVELSTIPRESWVVDVGQTPYGIAISRDDRYLFVTNEFDDTVSVVSLLMDRVECVVPVGRNPKDIAYIHTENSGDDYVIVSNYLGASIAVFGARCGTSPEMHEVGQLPAGIAIAPESDGSYTAYIAGKAEAAVRIFDFATAQLIDGSIGVGLSPIAIAVTPRGDKIYVVNSDENSVTVLGY